MSPPAVRPFLHALLLPLLLVGCERAPFPFAPTATDSNASSDDSTRTPTGVLLVVCDTLRADVLDPYGGDVGTPTFSRIARDGTVWLENYAQGPWTLPSMASLMTGRWVTDEIESLPASAPSVAPVLAEHDFATAAFVANPVCGSKRGFDRGFDTFVEFGERASARELTGGFLAWLERELARGDAPRDWFAWVHLMDNHGPYRPGAEFRSGPDSGANGPEASPADRAAWRAAADEHLGDAPITRRLDWALEGSQVALDTRDRYRGTVRAVDAALGRVLDELEARGLLETTLVVVASDHGELLFEHHVYRDSLRRRLRASEGSVELTHVFARGHDLHYREETWRTPLLMLGPNVPRGERVEHGSANLDLFPTLLDALGIAPPEELDGSSLLDADRRARDHVFASGVIDRRYGLYETRAVLELATGAVRLEAPRALIADTDDFSLAGVTYRLTDRAPLLVDEESAAARADLGELLTAWKRGSSLGTGDADPDAHADLVRLGYVDAPAVRGAAASLDGGR